MSSQRLKQLLRFRNAFETVLLTHLTENTKQELLSKIEHIDTKINEIQKNIILK